MAAIARSPPLGALVEQAWGSHVGEGLVRGLVNWRRFRDYFVIGGDAPPDIREKIQRNIKQSQAKSACVLREWWESAYHERSFMRASQRAFCDSALHLLKGIVMNP